MEEKKPEGIWEYIQSYLVYFILFGLFCVLLYTHRDFFFFIWRLLRLLEFTLITGFQSVLGVFGFDGDGRKALSFLLNIPKSQLTGQQIIDFELHFNEHLRYFYAAIIFWYAYRTHSNLKRVTYKHTLDSLIAVHMERSAAIKQLVNDNPLEHPLHFNFKKRDDHTNRHARGISPSQLLSANPIYLATYDELKKYRRNPESSRPICYIDNLKNTYDFSQERAVTCLERQITGVPVKKPFYKDHQRVPRLFDKDGQLIPLKVNNKKQIVGNFRQNNLINNGVKYAGSDEQIPLLFNATERKVLRFLEYRYRGKDMPFWDVVRLTLGAHAYSRTFFVELLSLVRINATIASSEFWIFKQQDRVLYYSLISSDEEMPWYEAIGVMAHHSMEKATQQGEIDLYVNSACAVLRQDAKRISGWVPPNNTVIDRHMNGTIEDPSIKEKMQETLQFDFDLLKHNNPSSGALL